jgi:hypothetical protein
MKFRTKEWLWKKGNDWLLQLTIRKEINSGCARNSHNDAASGHLRLQCLGQWWPASERSSA